MSKDGEGFPGPEECIMIFGGTDAVYSKRQHKVRYREACVTEMAVPLLPSLVGISDHF